jgi:phosphatidylserine/phosphatidylglycerophosphate/cardiolipin synthase-like enzyme
MVCEHSSLISGTFTAVKRLSYTSLAALFLSACSTAPTAIDADDAAAGLPETQLISYASAPRLDFTDATVLLDNDEAFEQKLKTVRSAQGSLDLAYYIFDDDFSSSLLAQELVAASHRGVRIRLLLDYFSNYSRLDLFRFLEREGSKGPGSLEVRFYNRPTEHIISDAVYLTLGCGEVVPGEDLEACSDAKLAAIELSLERARADVRDYNSGGSGLFLSGLYSKSPSIMALAITEGQQLDLSAFRRDPSLPAPTLEEKEKTLEAAIKAAKVYWQARASNPRPFEEAVANIKLGFAFTFFGDRINPLYDALKAYLPLYRLEQGGPALRDWDHLTDFLHHKLLLADGQTLILGGRNVEDKYHMRKNPLLQGYRFMDTDLRVDLLQPSSELSLAFEKIWDFRSMVATLDEVQDHAPNDFVAATRKADEICGSVERSQQAPGSGDCRSEVFTRYSNVEARLAAAGTALSERAGHYRESYRAAPTEERSPSIPVDRQARLFYLENLPFKPKEPGTRAFGARSGKEAESGKAIHAAWMAGMHNACIAATPAHPQRVVLHNAYFLPPANLLEVISDMAFGSLDCSDVELTVLTNSPATTDLRIINFGARYPIKAVADRMAGDDKPQRAARIHYLEYLPTGDEQGQSDISLHSKVSVLGPDLIIGSANADVRSFIMDTNNAVFIGNAPTLQTRYLEWLDGIIGDRAQTVELTGKMRKVSLEQMLQEDRATLQALLERKLSDHTDGEIPAGPVLDELENILENIYELSAKGLASGPGNAKAKERYDSLLKLL